MTTADTPTTPSDHQPRQRRWPRRVAVGVVVTGALLGGAYWYLGRETTLQMLVQRVANASGGSIVVTGVNGSLYGAMHVGKVVYRTPEQVITADNIDIDWSPFQYLSRGVAINKLHVATLRMDTLREGEPAKMPTRLAPPFKLEVDDARLAKVIMTNAAAPGAETVISDVRFDLLGDPQQWALRRASAITPWGKAMADASIGANHPFKLAGTASLTQLAVPAGQQPAQIKLRVGGDLVATQLDATAVSGKATGDAKFTLAPFDPIPLRAMTIHGKNIDPGFFNPELPKADLSLAITARIEANRNIAGSVAIDNAGATGPIDLQRLPLRAMRGELKGNLSALEIGAVLIDLGEAGKFTGSGTVARSADEKGLGTAGFALHTDGIDIKRIHSSMKSTRIAGDITVANEGSTQTFTAKLVEAGLRLEAKATLADNVLTVQQARLAAGASSVNVNGSANLAGKREFKVAASAVKFDPSAFGDLPKADINADINAAGVLSPAWKVAADFALRPSRLFDQPLSGKGKLNADATHISGVDATLGLGKNTAELKGSFGAPGEKLAWKVNATDLAAARSDLYGALAANGVVTGTMAAPRTTFEVDATSLGWVAAARKANNSLLHATGEAWLGSGATAGAVDLKAAGTAQRFNPAAFGSPLAGSINGSFDVTGRSGPDWRGNLNLALQPSTLANSPFWGHAKVAADARHVSNADVDLHVGPNIVAAKGSFGAASDKLDWRIDAPQLAALGPDYGGVLKGSGTVSGTMAAPAVSAALEGQNLKVLGKHQVKTLRASANLGSGRGADDPLVSDIAITEYVSGDTRIDTAHLQTSGTRGAHVMRLGARSEAFDAAGEIRGGWASSAWTGSVAALQNKGRYAFALQAPVPLRIAVAPGEGVAGLARPQQISMSNAVIKLPNGSVSVQSLDKNGPHWTSKGAAAGVPLTYLAQFSPGMRDAISGNLLLGADWSLDMQAPNGATPALNGMLHVFRESGDVIAGADVPVVLGLRTLDLRADVAKGSLRMQARIDGTRIGQANVDATAQMLEGRLGNASPLKMTANADMVSIAWLAPFTGQPGLELDGALKLALTGGGTVGTPTLNGNVNGDKLALRWAEQGVKLGNGQLRAQLTGDQLLLQRLSFDGVQGTAVADGAVRFAGGEATMQLKLVADKLEILSRPDRTVVVSGQSTLIRDAKRFSLEGKFKADRALIELAPQGRPTLSDDVIVLGRAGVGTPAVKAEPSMPLTMDLEADLGNAFRLRGMGIDAELAGSLRVRTTGGRPPRANGSIRVASGTYKAYGQNLDIERGVLTFSGPADNPSLNIRAVRRRPEGEQLSETNVEAGVEVRGSALSPVAKLVSTPSVPDSEKLSWLVLGHGMEATSGNEAGLLSAAAGALLGGSGSGGGFQSRLANSLGVDELGLSQAKGLESTVVTVGKRISSRAYLSFEQGATTASSLVKIRYKLNPRITLQFQTGTNTALDVLYSWAFD
ncbi:translocation/assembly module TamB domain-containing protein [Massilia violaceinigra]|uniref:Translocation/assembly module TamB domain-containing protein n=1 Tax=Massilia violaceinigra TaxID=2045208 RepID=A0ABY4AEM2_9BURK|nr:translocation/assembly module TamB domain-containing protein [Massilia violaceinigra]UOD32842.1 translocation/assembly module TamB domain-containing protein [Massilia violaceinigra]